VTSRPPGNRRLRARPWRGRAGHEPDGETRAEAARRRAGCERHSGHDVGRTSSSSSSRCSALLLVGITPKPRRHVPGLASRSRSGRADGRDDHRGRPGAGYAVREPALGSAGLPAPRCGMGWRGVLVGCRSPSARGPVPCWSTSRRGLSYRVPGCPPAVQLRVLAEPETVATRGSSPAATSAGPPRQPRLPHRAGLRLRAEPATSPKVATTDGWSDPGDSLRHVGRRGRRVAGVHPPRGRRGDHRGAPSRVAARRALALVLADRPVRRRRRHLAAGVPAARGGRRCGGCVPTRAHQVGRPRHGAAYGREPPYPDAARSLAVERSLDAARARCRSAARPSCSAPARRGTPAPGPARCRRRDRAGLARYNQGAALGATCGPDPGRPAPDQRIEAVYPDDTSDQDLQARPAALDRSGTGAGTGRRGVRALAAQRRRPQCRRGDRAATPGVLPTPAAPLTGDYGVDPRWPRPRNRSPSAVDGRYAAHEAAQLPSRLLVLVDTSSSMAGWCRAAPRRHRAAPVPPSRPTPWRRLAGLQPGDEFGLWLFPGGTPDAYTEAVPVGLRTRGSPPRGMRSPACSRVAARHCSAR
jgi:hypothetical protein